jgi:hypothetical protein
VSGELVAAPDAEAARLRDRLAELEVEHATLRTELTAFESDYLRQVGVVMAELHEAQARILAIVAVRSGAATDREAADAAAALSRETTTAIRSIPAPAGPPPTDDLKTLFRDAAKRMHPDLVPGDAARTHAEAFMKRLNQAYRKGDADAIRNLVRQWESSPYAAHDDSPEGAGRRIETLRVAVAQAEQRLEAARASELAVLMERALAASFAGRDLLVELRTDAAAALVTARARLVELDA